MTKLWYSGRTGSLVSLFFLALTFSLSAQADENLYEAGRRAFSDGLHVMAVRSFRQLVEQYPDSPWADDADYLRALAHFYLGESGPCIDVLGAFARRYPRSPHNARTSYWLAMAYLQQNRHREARDALSAQIERHPAEERLLEQSLLLRGMTEETLGLYRGARGSYARILERTSARRLWAETLFRLGGVELRLEGYAAALGAFSRVLVEFPDSPQAAESVFYAAEALFFLGRHAEAERRYLSVLSGTPLVDHRETSLFRLVRIRAGDRRLEQALAAAQELEQGFPRSRFADELAALKADLYFDLERYTEAYAQYRELLRPGRGAGQPRERQILLFNVGLSALLGGHPERAVEPLREAREGGDPGIAEESFLRLATALGDLRRDREAIETLEGFRRRFPASERSWQALELLASLHARNAQHLQAAEAYSRLLALDPLDPRGDELRFRRGSARLAGGEESGALKDFFAVVESPSSRYRAESLYNIGFVYSRRGEFARAQSYFELLLKESPPEELAGRAALAAGTSAFNAGEFEGALTWFLRNTAAGASPAWSGDSWLYLGRTYYRLDRLREAASSFATAAGLLDGTAQGEESLFWEGLALFRLGELERAQGVFRRLTERYPEGRRSAEAHYRSGLCAALAGRHEEGLNEFAKARARLGPRTDEYTRGLEQEILYQRAVSLLKLGRREQAAAGFGELAEGYPRSPLAAEGFFTLAEEDFRAGRYAAAFQGFVALIEGFPGRQGVLGAPYWAGVSAVRAGQAEQGLEYLLRYLEATPEAGLARVAAEEIRGVLSSLAGAGQAAVLERFYRRVENSRTLADEPRNQVRYEYAVYLFDRDGPQAFELLERIRASSPGEPLASQVNLLLGEYYHRGGDSQRALDIYRGITAASSQAGAASAQLAVGHILEEWARGGQGSLDEAADEYLKTFFLYPDFPDQAQEGLYRAGRVFWELGKRERARGLFERLAREFPDSPWLGELPAP